MGRTLFLPKELAHWVAGRPWLHVRYSDRARLALGKQEILLELYRSASRDDSKALAARLKPSRTQGHAAIPVVASSFLSRSIRATLEAKGVGYLDSAGRVHLPWSEGVVHLDADHTRSEPSSSTLGVHGVRAVQAILDQPSGIKLKELSARIKLSMSGTHAVLKTLEGEGLVRTSASGPLTRRTVIDRARLLDWLAAQPAARRRERHIDASLYARTPADAWRRLGHALDRAEIAYALTGSAAASILGAGPTSVAVSIVRITPDRTLEEALAALKVEQTDRGANLRLLRDVGMLGSMNSIEQEGVRVAPAVRVYLDALTEKRGEAIAEQFREVVLGY